MKIHVEEKFRGEMTLTLLPASNQMILLDNKYLEKSKLLILTRQLVVSFIHTPATQVAQDEQDFCIMDGQQRILFNVVTCELTSFFNFFPVHVSDLCAGSLSGLGNRERNSE